MGQKKVERVKEMARNKVRHYMNAEATEAIQNAKEQIEFKNLMRQGVVCADDGRHLTIA